MAARRGKSQAKRNTQSNESLPGWAWGVLGLLLGVVVILVAPKFLKSDGGDGFFRPQPNPDAQPAAVTADEESVAPEGNNGAKPASHADAADPKQAKAGKGKESSGYDFYTLLPGKEVEMSDAELAATEAAEEQRRATQLRKNPQTAAATPATAPATVSLPKPVDTIAPPAQPPAQVASATPPSSVTPKPPAVVATQGPAPAAATTASATTANAAAPAAANDNTRYLLQAGAFQASGQAEEMKAKIAMLGLGARVESAQISGKTVYRVRMGPYGTAGDLADAKRKLADGGLPGMAIKVQ
ncbi:SPOR domain-containing protein [Lysobacter gummosus]|uniref:SPOR domain-containing protein n=2 Tax=Lysobacter gummosus TaxID=262324 RepID=A0ABY3XDW2_9GAMM|nr:SPOR domain-containing protein [Lysobacter gummosus]ALN89426.1 sporulation related domain protein [Lysobacter gummosus]UNP30086.1 SPOR domain-containing protein [Lysobacter gummosus]